MSDHRRPPHALFPPTASDAARAAHRRRTLAAALRGATLAAAATLGALVGLGVRGGASLGRLGVIQLRLRGLPEFVTADRHAVGAALLGGAHLVAVSGAWGGALAWALGALRRRGANRLLTAGAALAGAATVALVDAALPDVLRLGAGSLSAAERALAALLVGAGAWGGAARDGA